MPESTPNLGLKKPLGNETVYRAAYNENLDIIDQNAAKTSDLAAHLADYVRQPGYAIATGSANTYTVNLDPALTAYTEGVAVSVKINVDNTGAATININSLGAKTIKKANGNDVSAGNLKAGSVYTLRYNGVNFILQGEGGGGTAQPGEVLAGKTFTNDNGDQTGSMPNRGAIIITPSAVDQIISDGYHNGAGKVNAVTFDASKLLTGTTIAGTAGTMPNRGVGGTVTPGTANITKLAGYYNSDIVVQGDADLVAGNILSGKNIFGVAGSVVANPHKVVLEGGNFFEPMSVSYDEGVSSVYLLSGTDVYCTVMEPDGTVVLATDSPIDITPYSKLYYYVYVYSGSVQVGMGTSRADTTFTASGSWSTSNRATSNFIDVSAYNGNYYIKIKGGGSAVQLHCVLLAM